MPQYIFPSRRTYFTSYLAGLGIPEEDVVKILEYAAHDDMIIDRSDDSWSSDELLIGAMENTILFYAMEWTENFKPNAIYAHLFQRND
jgi:hypothetical protein